MSHLRTCLALLVTAAAALGCGSSAEPLPLATNFAVVRVASGPGSYAASASFRTDVSASCETAGMAGGCVLSRCSTREPTGTPVEAGVLTVQGRETVVLERDNTWSVEAERTLYGNGEEVLIDLSESSAVPAFRTTLRAPSSTSLSAPAPGEKPLELEPGADLEVEWVPGNYGLMKFHASAGLVGVTCEWTISDGGASVSGALLDELPASDGSDSLLRFWTEQNDVEREGDWEFLFVLAGEALGGEQRGYVAAP